MAAFDFDGTLTVRDSFTAFLRWRKGSLAYLAGMVRLIPALTRWLSDRDRTRLKAAMVRIYLRGVPLAALEQEAAAFAEGHAARLLRPDALEAWARHGAEGAERVIVTASPDVTVAPFAARLGADRLIGTRLLIDGDGRVAGALDGLNCRGAEKVRRLREAYGEALRLTAAYGDTAGDTEMLAIADRPGFRVFRGRP
jgi:phosphatidylglycerophosphatase C